MIATRSRPARMATTALLVAVLSGCAANSVPQIEPGPSPTPSPTSSARHGIVDVDVDDTRVAYWCEGEGTPVTILEAGDHTDGMDAWAAIMDSIADVTTVCTYNRLGVRGSSAPPDHARTPEDVVGVLDSVLAALELEPPYVMAGQSGGGNIAIAYAHTHPDRVAALVPIEAYHDDPAKMLAWQTAEGFTWEDNAEHVDVVPWSVEQDAYAFPFGEFPVLVISASNADPGGPDNQSYWLGISPNSRQVVVDGTHDLQWAATQELATELMGVVTSLQDAQMGTSADLTG
jgi:hypothetical protein